VHKVILNDKPVAVKVLIKEEDFEAEMKIMTELNHPNLVCYLVFFFKYSLFAF
jgi:serine/threonine protein kinase